jgi:2-polyprenyl-6-methoxyphenol hydroxylase-like FAD-dependent oxidoreductase
MGEGEHAVVIAGRGPTGMMLAAELALAGIDVAIVERRSDHVRWLRQRCSAQPC